MGLLWRDTGCSRLVPWVPFHHQTRPRRLFVPADLLAVPPCVSLALPRFLQGPVASLAERGCPCPSLPVPRLCPASKPVEAEALSPQSCLCPGASCRDRAVLLLSDNIPIWALIDLLIPSPGPCYAESLSPAQPCHQQLPTSASPQPGPRAKLSQIPSCQTSDNILEQRPSVPSSTLGGVFGAAPHSPAASSLGNALMPIQAVQKKIEAKIHDQVKVCDMLLHQLKQWSQARDERQRHLQELQDAETDPKWQEPQLQVPRSPSWCANTHGGL